MIQVSIKTDAFTHTAYPWPSGGVTLQYTPYGTGSVSQNQANIEDARQLGIEPVLDISFAELDPESYVPQKDGEQVLLEYLCVTVNGKKDYVLLPPYVIRKL